MPQSVPIKRGRSALNETRYGVPTAAKGSPDMSSIINNLWYGQFHVLGEQPDQ